MFRLDAPPHTPPGLLVSVRPDGHGRVSWPTRDWRTLTPADVQAAEAQARRHAWPVSIWMAEWVRLGACQLALWGTKPSATPAPRPVRPFVLVMDEAAEAPKALNHLLEQARALHPPGTAVWVCATALDAHQGRTGPLLRRGRHGALPPGVQAITGPVHMATWVAQASALHTLSAPEGFEALLHGVPVVLGPGARAAPFYQGWGLTQHHAPTAPTGSKGPVSLTALFTAVALVHSQWADVARTGHGTLADWLAALATQHRERARFADLGCVEAQGMARWKRPLVRPFLEASGHPLRWRATVNPAGTPHHPGARTVAVWGNAPAHGPVLRVEDGFLRSAGLGSDLRAPRSLLLDRRGLAVDAHGPSELLTLLNHAEVPQALQCRAEALRHSVVRHGLSKYNFRRAAPEGAWLRDPRPKVLVCGQVADDAAMTLGTSRRPGAVHDTDTLLQAARRLRPDALLVYKPHPDVLAGNRSGLVKAHARCDVVDTKSDLVSLLGCVDEVHVVTSLAGLDALVRGVPVVTHGLPFYAGWGFTQDQHTDELRPLRRRPLDLNAFLAIAWLLHPLYWDVELGVFTQAEWVARHLAWEAQFHTLPHPGQWTTRTLGKTSQWLNNLI